MDAAHRGEAALTASKYDEAITHYTTAISQSPTSPTYYIKRSIAYQRTGNFTAALEDAEIAVINATQRAKRELIAQAQMRRGIALYNLARYGDAQFLFEKAKKLDEKEKSVKMWEEKVKSKIQALEEGDDARKITVKEVPDLKIAKSTAAKPETEKAPAKPHDVQVGTTKSTAEDTNLNGTAITTTSSGTHQTTSQTSEGAQTPANKIRHEWYQNNETVYVTLFAKGVPKDKATVDIEAGSVTISFPLATGSQYDFSLEPLFAAVDARSSSFHILGTKVEVMLKKLQPGQKWSSLEGTSPVVFTTSADDVVSPVTDAYKHAIHDPPTMKARAQLKSVPSYPTSSRTGPKNWDKIVSSYSKPQKRKSNENSAHSSDDEDESKNNGARSKTKDDKDDAYVDFDEDGDGDDVNKFFKQLYKNATPETRRAMVKSFQESGGTALSTNWEEVSKAKVAVTPPEGMEEKKWEQ